MASWVGEPASNPNPAWWAPFPGHLTQAFLGLAELPGDPEYIYPAFSGSPVPRLLSAWHLNWAEQSRKSSFSVLCGLGEV